MSIIIGVTSLVCIIVGAVLTSLKQGDDKEQGKSLKKGLLVLLLSTAGFVGYVVLIRWFEIDGWSANSAAGDWDGNRSIPHYSAPQAI